MVQFFYSLTIISVPQIVSVCLLGLVNHLVCTRAFRTLLSLLLFYARKAIVLVWKSDRSPSLDCWKTPINSVIPLYKIRYLFLRKKFHKVWDIWHESPSITEARIDTDHSALPSRGLFAIFLGVVGFVWWT